jgi:hypothetical protein
MEFLESLHGKGTSRKSAGDYFESAYNTSIKKGKEIECNEAEMMLVIAEALWNADLEVYRDAKGIADKMMMQEEVWLGRNERAVAHEIGKQRRLAVKKGKVDTELLTSEEKMILLHNLRKIKVDNSGFSILKNRRKRGIKVCAILPMHEGERTPVRLFYDSYKEAARNLSLSERLVSRCANGL